MKNLILLLVLLLTVTFIHAQELNKIDVKVAQYPKTFATSEELAELINSDFESEEDKARAIYTWICMNVQFDVKAQFKKKKRKRLKYKDKADRAQKLRKRRIATENKALQQHLAVAEGYATLYKRVCDLCDIWGYMIKGTAKLRTFDLGKQPRIQNHTWNVVQINKEWKLVDCAMGAGTVDYIEKSYKHLFNEKYFFTPPEDFFLNHFPKEQKWCLLEKTADDFAKQPLFYSDFLRTDFELVEPETGVLEMQGADSIQFKIKSPEEINNLTFQYNFDKMEARPAKLEKEGDYFTFRVPFTTKRRGYLNIYHNKKAIVSFKINSY